MNSDNAYSDFGEGFANKLDIAGDRITDFEKKLARHLSKNGVAGSRNAFEDDFARIEAEIREAEEIEAEIREAKKKARASSSPPSLTPVTVSGVFDAPPLITPRNCISQ